MKKIKYLLLIILCLPMVVFASTTKCQGSYFTNISTNYTFTYCFRAGCDTLNGNQWDLYSEYTPYGNNRGYSCTNGNKDPYKERKSNDCSAYKGKCTVQEAQWCTQVFYIDCKRKSDGSAYSGSSTPVEPTQKRTVTVSPSNTTKKATTREKYTGTGKIIITTTEKQQTTGNTRPVASTETTTTEPVKSSNTGIRKILINGTDLKYRNEYNEYTIKLKKGIRDIDVVVESEDENADIYIEGANNMSDDDNVVSIIIVAENGESKTVTIKVKRYEGESNDCNIANIAVTDYEISHFDKNVFDYTLGVKNKTKSLNLEIIPSDPLHADYEIKGNENLQNNSIVTIQVKAEDGTMCYYTIKVRKTSGFWLVLFIIIIITILLLLAGYFVYRYLKRSKNQYEYE